MASAAAPDPNPWPTVTVVFLAYNRRDDLRLSLKRTLEDLDYKAELLNVVVVDNASTDGTAEMLSSEFPDVRLIRRSWNCGVSGFNDGFAVATGDYVLALDDDCYLPPEGLRRAIDEASREAADLVSFGVQSGADESYRFDVDEYPTGLLAFWGCAVLMRRDVLQALRGYDPAIFVWANELEFMVRFFDAGFRHLHLPEVVAVHAKDPPDPDGSFPERPYRFNARHFSYVAAKLLQPRDAATVFMKRLVRSVRDGVRVDVRAFKGIADTLAGFRHGVRHRRPVRAEVSSAYRGNFIDFQSPFAMSRRPPELARARLRRGTRDVGRRKEWLARRPRFYPERREVLEL